MAAETRIFFPLLERQKNYPCKEDGSHYGYAYYKDHIAADCQQRCVYCDVLEEEVGGPEAMQLDHFRPESLPEFQHLVNDPLNIHYGCGRCNRWKSNNWPALGTPHTHNGTEGFVDPFAVDRLKYFSIERDGRIKPTAPPAPYMIRLLHLDREFLRKLRYKRILMAQVEKRVADLEAELQADAQAGRLSAPEKMLTVINLWKQVRTALK